MAVCDVQYACTHRSYLPIYPYSSVCKTGGETETADSITNYCCITTVCVCLCVLIITASSVLCVSAATALSPHAVLQLKTLPLSSPPLPPPPLFSTSLSSSFHIHSSSKLSSCEV